MAYIARKSRAGRKTRAANCKGLMLTEFIIQQAVEHLRHSRTWTLERSDAELFAETLMKPAKLGPQLKRAARRYKEPSVYSNPTGCSS